MQTVDRARHAHYYNLHFPLVQCIHNLMSVARILVRVVRTTSRDKGDVTIVTDCSSPQSSQHTHMVASRRRQFTFLKLNFTTARILSIYQLDYAVVGFRRVLLEKVAVFLLFIVGGSAVDCPCCRFNITYAISALNLHLIQQRQDFWLEYIVRLLHRVTASSTCVCAQLASLHRTIMHTVVSLKIRLSNFVNE